MLEILATALLIVSTDARDQQCPGALACYKGGVIHMAEYRSLPMGRYLLDVPDVHFPHFSNPDRHEWMECGRKIAAHNGLTADYNAAAILCHEASHAAGNTH